MYALTYLQILALRLRRDDSGAGSLRRGPLTVLGSPGRSDDLGSTLFWDATL